MTDEEHASIRAEIAALWTAIRDLNNNDQNLLANVYRLSNRLLVHEATQVSEEMRGERYLQ